MPGIESLLQKGAEYSRLPGRAAGLFVQGTRLPQSALLFQCPGILQSPRKEEENRDGDHFPNLLRIRRMSLR